MAFSRKGFCGEKQGKCIIDMAIVEEAWLLERLVMPYSISQLVLKIFPGVSSQTCVPGDTPA
jgi:hypothetical protein